jgi:hypothetical protein
MMKAAVFAGALVLGFASAAQAVTVDFSGLAVGNGASIPTPSTGPGYSIAFNANDRYWSNSDNFYATSAIDDVSYANGDNGTWTATITATAGNFIQFDRFVMVRPAVGAQSGLNTTVSMVGTGTNISNNRPAEPTVFNASHIFDKTYASAQTTGSVVTLSFTDNGTGDFALDLFSFTVQPVPEPTVLAPMALAGMGMFLRRRRA